MSGARWYDRVTALFFVLIVLLAGCKTENAEMPVVERLGDYAYTLKMLDGLIYEWQGESFLISGTEVTLGAQSQVFAYNVTDDELTFCAELENSSSMTGFCDAGDFVCFATISASTSMGCDLYTFDKTVHTIEHHADIPAKGIYSLAWDGADEVFIGTAYPAALYRCNLRNGDCTELCSGFTKENFVRSLSYVDGFCYLGIGTKADLIAVEVSTGNWKSILPAEYQEGTWIYSQCSYGKKIAMVVSPSYTLLEYDTSEESFRELEFPYVYSEDVFVTTLTAETPVHTAINLLGNLIVLQGDHPVGAISPQYSTLSYWEPRSEEILCLTSSGIFRRLSADGEILFQKSFVDSLEKSYVVPTEFLAYAGVLYIPGREFLCGKPGKTPKMFLVADEPQASTVTADGIYTTNYTACTVYFYPFALFESDPETVQMNDREYLLADIENQCRPTEMKVTPDGRYLLIGSGPMYGHFGGAVSAYDLLGHELMYTHENVVPGHKVLSVTCSSVHDGAVWLGTSTYGENTSPRYLDETGHLLLWDIEKESILLDVTIPDPQERSVGFIAETVDKVLCLTSSGSVYAFDVFTGEMLGQLDQKLRIIKNSSSDGGLYGVSFTEFFRIDPNTLEVEVLADGFTSLDCLTEDPVTGEWYAFDETELIRFSLPYQHQELR